MVTYWAWDAPTQQRLLRRTVTGGQARDEVFRDDEWHTTGRIVDYEYGHDDNVDGPISEARAREVDPAAFS